MPRKSTIRDTPAENGHGVPPILDPHEVSQRSAVLAELRDALAERDVPCVLTRNHRLVLRYNQAPCEPSGPTDPQLRIFTSAGAADVITTDGTAYRLAGGGEWSAAGPVTVASVLGARESSQVGGGQ